MTRVKLIAAGYMAMLVVTVNARTGVRPADLVVRVRFGDVPTIAMAEGQAGLILSQVGIRVRWERLDPRRSQPVVEAAECGQTPASISVIDLQILDESNRSDHPGALGYAKPFQRSGIRVVIFYDRVAALEHGPRMLGHVMAHELGHMLMGTNGHSESGMMMARWRPDEVLSIRYRPLEFTAYDADMIARNVAQQGQGCVSPSHLGHATEDFRTVPVHSGRPAS